MTTVTYTDNFEPRSSAVNEILHNENTNELFVEVKRGEVYRYDHVGAGTYSDFLRALSKGHFYGKEIKKKFGPGEHLGYRGNLTYTSVARGVPAPDMSSTATATPKGLTYSVNAVVDDKPVTSESKVFDLKIKGDSNKLLRKHTVRFTIDGGSDVKTHTTQATDVDAVIAELEAMATNFNRVFTLKEITVSYE